MTGVLFGVPQPPQPREVAVLLAVAGLLAALAILLFLALRQGKDDRAD